MAKTKQNTLMIPNLGDLTDRADKLRADLEKNARKLGRQARGYLPKAGQRSVDAVVDRVTEVNDEIAGRVADLRKDLEKRVEAARKSVDKQVAPLRKEVESRRKKAVTEIERTARKQIERVFKRLSLPTKGELDSLKRRMTSIERKIDELAHEVAKKNRAAA